MFLILEKAAYTEILIGLKYLSTFKGQKKICEFWKYGSDRKWIFRIFFVLHIALLFTKRVYVCWNVFYFGRQWLRSRGKVRRPGFFLWHYGHLISLCLILPQGNLFSWYCVHSIFFRKNSSKYFSYCPLWNAYLRISRKAYLTSFLGPILITKFMLIKLGHINHV